MKPIKLWAAFDGMCWWVTPYTKAKLLQMGFRPPTWILSRVEIRDVKKGGAK